MSILPLRLMWMSFSTRVTGIVLIKDTGIDPIPTMESGFTFLPRECPVP
jgi:hypothetical protein